GPAGFLMLYKTLGTPTPVGFASSPDGVHWQKAEAPLFAADLLPGSSAIGSLSLLAHDGQLWLYSEQFRGSRNRTDIYLLQAPLP
ncbi:MAG: hypothetical protein KDE04_12175, partial [Anaerolineales bacterium]|nr:hypothetical protein [Anaerolineales bacterium]